jgi:hypothetical protein
VGTGGGIVSDQPDPYGWDAWVSQTDHSIVGAMIRDKCEQLRQARLVCADAAKRLSEVTGEMTPGGRALAHTLGVIADLEDEGSKSDGV